jgi:hypothetical protein
MNCGADEANWATCPADTVHGRRDGEDAGDRTVKNFKDWMAEGEQIYGDTLAEYQNLQTQLEELEQKLIAKREEVNSIASVIGKPPVDPPRRAGGHAQANAAAVQLVDRDVSGAPIPASRNTIAKALVGKGLNAVTPAL